MGPTSVGELRDPINRFLSNDVGQIELDMDARNRRGQPIKCHISSTRQYDIDGTAQGVVLLMEEKRV